MNYTCSERVEIYAQRQPWRWSIAIFMYLRTVINGAESVKRAEPIVWKDLAPSDMTAVTGGNAMLNLPADDAQNLMDELWRCGLRPTEGSGSAGSLAATERHLQDMRSLVFKIPPRWFQIPSVKSASPP